MNSVLKAETVVASTKAAPLPADGQFQSTSALLLPLSSAGSRSGGAELLVLRAAWRCDVMEADDTAQSARAFRMLTTDSSKRTTRLLCRQCLVMGVPKQGRESPLHPIAAEIV